MQENYGDSFSFFLFFLFFGSTGVRRKGFTLTRQALYHLSHSLALFVLIIFEIGSHKLFAVAGVKLPYLCPLSS
jgi:hypothetical protein